MSNRLRTLHPIAGLAIAFCGVALASFALFIGAGLIFLADSPKAGPQPVQTFLAGAALVLIAVSADCFVATFLGRIGVSLGGIFQRLMWTLLGTAAGFVLVSFAVSGGRWIF